MKVINNMKQLLLTVLIAFQMTAIAQIDSLKLREAVYADVEFVTLQGFSLPDYQFENRPINIMLQDAVTYRQKAKQSVAGAVVMYLAGTMLLSAVYDPLNPNARTISNIGYATTVGGLAFTISAISNNDKAKVKYRSAELRRMAVKQGLNDR